jgi:hypothetical protein
MIDRNARRTVASAECGAAVGLRFVENVPDRPKAGLAICPSEAAAGGLRASRPPSSRRKGSRRAGQIPAESNVPDASCLVAAQVHPEASGPRGGRVLCAAVRGLMLRGPRAIGRKPGT